MTKKFMFTVFTLFAISVVIFFIFNKKNKNSTKSFVNVVLIGIAGSGKGTQGDLLKEKYNLYKLSAGDALREHRENNGKYSKIINEKIDKGELVPSEIASNIMFEKVEQVLEEGKFNGIIYDGFPRNKENDEALSNFLKSKNMKIDTVVYINVTQDAVIDRLVNRYSCKTCGEIYNKKTKPTKTLGVCDKCGGIHFSDRADDADVEAIKNRFKIFEENTLPVLQKYIKEGIVIEVDGNKLPEVVFGNLIEKINTIFSK